MSRGDARRLRLRSTRLEPPRLIARRGRRARSASPPPAAPTSSPTFAPRLKWIKTSGIITPDKWGNLPGGEVFTAPARVDGRFVVDGVVGDYLVPQVRRPADDAAARSTIADSRIAGARLRRRTELLDEFRAYTSTDDNSDRVGEFAIGTNIAVQRRHRQHPAGREDPRRPHRLRPPLRRAHRRRLALHHPHRLRRRATSTSGSTASR